MDNNHHVKTLRDVLLIVILGFVVVLPSLFTRDLWGPDEPRYLEVAREMVALKDFIVPRLNGELYTEKPPFFFWLAALFYQLGCGFNSGRMVAGLATIATLLLTYRIGSRFWKPPAPLFASLSALTALLFLSYAKTGVIDPLFMFLTTAAITCGLWALHSRAPGEKKWWLGFYGLMGLAVLTKGHVGVLLPGIVVLVYGIWNRRTLVGGGWMHLVGVLLLLGIVAGWLIPAGVAGGADYLYTLTVRQVTERVADSEAHNKPFYYYIANYPVFFLPWSLLFLLAVESAVRSWRNSRESPALAMLVWFFAIFLVFSAVSCKRDGYLLPLVPAFALMMGRYLGSGLREGWPRIKTHRVFFSITLLLAGLACLLVAASIVILALAPHIALYAAQLYDDTIKKIPAITPFTLAIATALIAAAIAAFYSARFSFVARRSLFSSIVLLASIFLISITADFVALPLLNNFKSPMNFYKKAAPYLKQADKVYTFPNDMNGMYNLYTGWVRIPILKDKGALLNALNTPSRVAVIAKASSLDSTKPLLAEKYWISAQGRVGHRQMLLITNWDTTLSYGESGTLKKPPE